MKKLLLIATLLILGFIAKSEESDTLRYFLVSFKYKDTVPTNDVINRLSIGNCSYIYGDGQVVFAISKKEQKFIGKNLLETYIKSKYNVVPQTSTILIFFIYEFKDKEEYEYFNNN